MAFVLDNLKDARWIISLTQLHKGAKFYPDVYFADHSKHITLAHLDKLGMCGAAKNFAAGILHWQPKEFYKGSHPESKAPPAYRKAPSSELVNIAGSMYKAWGSGSGRAEQHKVRVAGVDVFSTFQTNEVGEPILPDYAFAFCPPDEWLLGHVMDPDILPAGYIMEDPDAAVPSVRPLWGCVMPLGELYQYC